VATIACGGCTGLFSGGFLAIAVYLIALFIAWFFFLGVEPETIFEAYGGPIRAATRLILEFGGIGVILGLAAGYVVGYTPTEIARLRAKEPGGDQQ
jgi:hypothetical protein